MRSRIRTYLNLFSTNEIFNFITAIVDRFKEYDCLIGKI